MNPHEVNVDWSSKPPILSFSSVFNVGVNFVDRHIAEGRGDKVMARSSRGDMTYSQLADGAYRMAAALGRLGIQKGDRVLLLIPDIPEFYFAFLGVVRLGAIAVLANTFLKGNDYAYMLAESGAKTVFVASVSLQEFDTALREPGIAIDHKIAVDLTPPPGWLGMEELMRVGDGSAPQPEPTTAVTDCFILYSSGSTGKPKGCVHQHKNLIYLAVLFAQQIIDLNENDIIFSIGKLFFAYGINNSLGFPLWVGCSVVLLEERATAENALAVMTAGRPTIYFSVPTALVHQLAAIEHGVKADLSSLRACVVGGETLSPTLFERWKKLTGLELIEGVGSSEALHIYISNEMGRVKIGSVGRVVPGYDVEIRGIDGKCLPDNEIGEIVIRGESLAKYYWRKPEKTAECMRNGWFRTGDIGYRDAEGFVYFSGRNDDMLRVGSMWVAPSEVEAALMEHPSVLEVAVVGAEDEHRLIKPKAFVVLRDPDDATPKMEDEIIAAATSRLPGFKCPRSVVFMQELPKTATGKIQRFRLR